MSTKIFVDACFSATVSGSVNLPEGVSSESIQGYYMKWGILHIKVSEEWQRVGEVSFDYSSDMIDWQRPTNMSILPEDPNEPDEPDYSTCLYSI